MTFGFSFVPLLPEKFFYLLAVYYGSFSNLFDVAGAVMKNRVYILVLFARINLSVQSIFRYVKMLTQLRGCQMRFVS